MEWGEAEGMTALTAAGWESLPNTPLLGYSTTPWLHFAASLC